MPILAIISDVHGNIDALEAVLADVDAKASEVLCLGDMVGYGAAASECVELISKQCGAIVKGNHEDLTVRLELDNYPERVAAGIRYAKNTLSQKQIDWLENLPLVHVHETNGLFVTLVHASLKSPEEFAYLSTNQEAFLHFQHQTTLLCFHGHTHIPLIVLDEDGCIGWDAPSQRPVRHNNKRRTVVNVGSVGQPRDGDPRACYVLFDTDSNVLTFHRVTYDIKRAQERIIEAGLPLENASRLAMGQ